jgi:hypothetical protein
MNLLIVSLMIIITTAIHATGMLISLHIANYKIGKTQSCHRLHCVLRTSGIVIIMFVVSLIEVVAWAVPFLAFEAIDGLEKAVYFSMVTYTTLGYGDVLLNEQWRLLASFEAANGIIMFGWTTAIVMYVIRDLFFGLPVEKENP